MTTYIAFLRGIAPMNPNMKNEKLRGVFENLGFTNVSSVVSSGNIIFETPEADIQTIEKRVETALRTQLGITSTTIIRSASQIQQLIDKRPFGDAVHTATNYLIVTFLQHQPPSPLTFPDKYHITAVYDREVCSVNNSTHSDFPDPMQWIERNYGKEITTRTWLTIERVMKKMSQN